MCQLPVNNESIVKLAHILSWNTVSSTDGISVNKDEFICSCCCVSNDEIGRLELLYSLKTKIQMKLISCLKSSIYLIRKYFH